MSSVYIIAEAGVNHNGDIQIAKKLIEEAKKCGADAIKFQTFKAKNLVTKNVDKARYQKENDNSSSTQYDMLRKLELNYEDFIELQNYANLNKIDFLSSAFDIESIEFLEKLDMKYFKIPSGEITNLPYLRRVAATKKTIILSTGMSTYCDIERAVNILKEYGSDDIYILHCNTEYPTPMEDVNLRAMINIGNAFGLKFGYSDHTKGIEIPIAAVTLGAEVIEKHFTLDNKMKGPDHIASLNPIDFKSMVQAIRNVEVALGDGVKKLSNSEKSNIKIVRKSIVAKYDILKDEVFSEDNLTVKRPGNGISPFMWDSVMGRKAKKNFLKDELIEI